MGHSDSKSRTTEHHRQWTEAEDFLVQKTGIRERWKLADLVSTLLLHLRTRQALDQASIALPAAPFRSQLEVALPAAMLEAVQRDHTLLWLITASLVRRHLFRRNSGRESRDTSTEKGEQVLEASSRALGRLEGGLMPLRKYVARQESGEPERDGGFWAYLQKCVERTVVEPFRIKKFLASLWDNTGTLADEPPDADGKQSGVAPKDIRYQAERCLIRAQNSEERKRTLLEVRGYAEREAGEGDSSAKIMLELLDWLAAQPGDVEPSQAEFARAAGHPTGTVNAAVFRFRNRFKKGPGRTLVLEDIASIHGGSIS